MHTCKPKQRARTRTHVYYTRIPFMLHAHRTHSPSSTLILLCCAHADTIDDGRI